MSKDKIEVTVRSDEGPNSMVMEMIDCLLTHGSVVEAREIQALVADPKTNSVLPVHYVVFVCTKEAGDQIRDTLSEGPLPLERRHHEPSDN